MITMSITFFLLKIKINVPFRFHICIKTKKKHFSIPTNLNRLRLKVTNLLFQGAYIHFRIGSRYVDLTSYYYLSKISQYDVLSGNKVRSHWI